MYCWICREECNKTNLCNCNNDFSYCHKECLKKWITISNKTKCDMCKSYYKFPIYYNLCFIIKNLLIEIKDFYFLLCEYNLETGIRWEEHYD